MIALEQQQHSLDEAARWLAAEFGALVFPLGRRGKLPAIRAAHPEDDPLRGVCRGGCGHEGHGLYDGTNDPERIAAWWRRWPKANIGMRTGVTFDVLDLDGDDALDLLFSLAPHGDETWLPACWASTGRGWHVYVQPTGRANAARLLPGIDWRGEAGYVVAPPSVHPSGATYRWWTFDADGSFVPCDSPAAIEPAPAWMLELLDRKNAARKVTRCTATGTTRRRGDGGYGRRALQLECWKVASTPHGGRNDQLNKSAFVIGQLVAGGHVDQDEAVADLLKAAELAGTPAREADSTVTSGLSHGKAHPRHPKAPA